MSAPSLYVDLTEVTIGAIELSAESIAAVCKDPHGKKRKLIEAVKSIYSAVQGAASSSIRADDLPTLGPDGKTRADGGLRYKQKPPKDKHKEDEGRKNAYLWLLKEITARENEAGSLFQKNFERSIIRLAEKRNQFVHMGETEAEDYPISELAHDLLVCVQVLEYLAFERNTGPNKITWGSEENRARLQALVAQMLEDLAVILEWAKEAEAASAPAQ